MIEVLKKLSCAGLIVALTACGTTMGDFQKAIEKYPENRFCVMAIEPIAAGRTNDAVRNSKVGNYNWCSNNLNIAKTKAIEACSKRVGAQCLIAYTFDRETKRYDSYQSKNMKDYEDAVKESKMKKCDGYGFTRGTTPFAQCLQQVEQQESMDSAIQMQQNELDRQAQERQWRKAQCYASGRLDC